MESELRLKRKINDYTIIVYKLKCEAQNGKTQEEEDHEEEVSTVICMYNKLLNKMGMTFGLNEFYIFVTNYTNYVCN